MCESIEAARMKHLTSPLWERLSNITNSHRVGILFPCMNHQAVRIYDSYMTTNLYHKTLFKSYKYKLFIEIAEKVQELHLSDRFHLLPMASTLKGNYPVPDAVVVRDLINIRDHLEADWKLIIIKEQDNDSSNFLDDTEAQGHLFSTTYGTQYRSINDSQEISSRTVSQGEFIELLLKEMQAYPQTRKNIELNLPDQPKPVALSGGHFLRQYFIDNFNGQDIGKDFGAFRFSFSPSYNLRILAPSENALEFVVERLEEFSCKKYTDLVRHSKSKLIRSREKKFMASIVTQDAYRFLKEILNIPLTTIEHYLRYQFVSTKYFLKKSKTVREAKDKIKRINENKYYDLQLKGSKIIFNGEAMSFTEFVEEKKYCTVMQARNVEPSFLRGGKNVIIEEKNLVTYFLQELHRDYKHLHAAGKWMFHPLRFYFPQENHHSLQNISTFLDFSEIALFIKKNSCDPGNSAVDQSVLALVDYFYKSISLLIVQHFKQAATDDFYDLEQLTTFYNHLQSYLENFFLTRIGQFEKTILFTLWFFEQLILLSFLKGNFFLFEIISAIFKSHQIRLESVVFDGNSTLFELLSFSEGILPFFENEHVLAVALRYSENYNMIVLPSPALLQSIQQKIENNETAKRLSEFVAHSRDKISKLNDSIVDLQLDENLISEVLRFQVNSIFAGMAEPSFVSPSAFVAFLDEVCFAKRLVDIFPDTKKEEVWGKFKRIILLRDSSETRRIVENLILRSKYAELCTLFAFNLIPAGFLEWTSFKDLLTQASTPQPSESSAIERLEQIYNYFMWQINL